MMTKEEAQQHIANFRKLQEHYKKTKFEREALEEYEQFKNTGTRHGNNNSQQRTPS